MLDGLLGARAVWHSYRLSVWICKIRKWERRDRSFYANVESLSCWVTSSQWEIEAKPQPWQWTTQWWVPTVSEWDNRNQLPTAIVDVTVKSDGFPGPNPRQGDHFLSVHRSGCVEQRQQTCWTMDFTMAPLEWSTWNILEPFGTRSFLGMVKLFHGYPQNKGHLGSRVASRSLEHLGTRPGLVFYTFCTTRNKVLRDCEASCAEMWCRMGMLDDVRLPCICVHL